jgi:hypothetical protein
MPKHFVAVTISELDALRCSRKHSEQVEHAIGLETVFPVEDHRL